MTWSVLVRVNTPRKSWGEKILVCNMFFQVMFVAPRFQVHSLATVRGKILEGENFGESLLTNQMARKILANQLAGLQLFHCIYNYWRGKFWRFVHHSPKFSPSKFFPRTVSTEHLAALTLAHA